MECGFTLKGVRDVIRTYSQMHRTDEYLQCNSITLKKGKENKRLRPVWLNG